MAVGNFGQRLSPGNEQRDFWGRPPPTEGSRNCRDQGPGRRRAGRAGSSAPDSREDLIAARPRARPCAAVGLLRDPAMAQPGDPVAYWDKFGAAGAVAPLRGRPVRLVGRTRARRPRSRRPARTWVGEPTERPRDAGLLIRRLLLMIPTLFGIMLINFVIIQALPGGPVEQMISRAAGQGVGATARITGGGGGEARRHGRRAGRSRAPGPLPRRPGARPRLIAELKRQYGFDKPRLAALRAR